MSRSNSLFGDDEDGFDPDNRDQFRPSAPPSSAPNSAPPASEYLPRENQSPLSNSIRKSLDDLLARSTRRNSRMARIKTLLREINGLIKSIEEMLAFVKEPGGSYEDIMKELGPTIAELKKQSNIADTDFDSLEKDLENIARRLRTTHSSLEKQTKKASSSRPPDATDGSDFTAPPALRGGYKHSKTNSRKYMVKRFRSARMSLKRDKKRKRKTLRRRSSRK